MDNNKCGCEPIEPSRRRENIVNALNVATEAFTSNNGKNFDEVMTNGIKPIAEAAGIDRVAVYRLLNSGGRLGQVYLWHGKALPLMEELIVVPNNPPVIRWLEVLKKDVCINGNVRKMAPDEMAFLDHFGVKSIFFVPVFTHREFWGVITLEDHTKNRTFEDDHLDLLRSAANLFTSAIVRAEMERGIAEADEFTRAILDDAPIGYTVADENLRIFDCNDTMPTLLGTTKQNFVDNFFDFSPEFQPDGLNSREKAINLMKKALNGEKQAYGWIHRSSSGELIPFEITLKRALHNGKYMLQAYQYDLTNIRKMEKAVAEAEKLTRAVTEASPNPYVLFDENLKPLDCNEAMMRILACQDKSYILEHYWEKFTPELQPDGTYSSQKAKLGKTSTYIGRQTKFEWVHKSLHGELIPMENTMTQIVHQGKRYFISFKYDLRNTKKMMESMQKQSEQLKEAFEKATIASKAKGEFLSNMSHEMRTPLNAIIGMTTIGKGSDEMERKNYALDKIEKASTHLLGVINDILDMSKIEAKKFSVSPIEFNFEEMLQQVVNVSNIRLEEKRLKFIVHIDPAIPKTIIGDDQRITQVITNLLSNAVKFTPESGSVRLDTNFLGEEKDEGTGSSYCTIQISVTDSGIGISAEQQSRLFESFEQVESNTARKYGGTGLGLTISKSIVELMGGKIWMESELKKGSTFSFTIKVKRARGKNQKFLSQNINWGKIRTMAVDNDPAVLEHFRDIMSGFGITCDTASSYAEALRLTEQNGPYNICFIDWKTTEEDSLELSRILKIKVKSPGKSIVIMVPASGWNDIEGKVREVGISKFILKPLFPSTIVDSLNEIFGMKRPEELARDIKGIFAGNRILLVEDVEINREIVLQLLASTQLKIDCAENGVKAVQMFNESPQKYDMILMDVHMPEMDGYEATRQIRAIEEERDISGQIPIVAMTANVFREDIEMCLEAGMDSHIGKPLDFTKFLDKLRYYLPNKKSEAESIVA